MEDTSKLPQVDDTPEGRLRTLRRNFSRRDYLDGGSPKHKTLQKNAKRFGGSYKNTARRLSETG